MKIIKTKWMLLLLVLVPFVLWLIGYVVKILHLTIGEEWPLHHAGIIGVLGTMVTGLIHLFLVSCGLFLAGLVIFAILLWMFESEGT
jgi:hypothetical protein